MLKKISLLAFTVSLFTVSFAQKKSNITAADFCPVPIETFTIQGFPYPEPGCYEPWGIYSFRASPNASPPYTFSYTKWGWRNTTNNTSYDDPTFYGLDYGFIPEVPGNYEVWVKGWNSCGLSLVESVKYITVSSSCAFPGSADAAESTVQQNVTPLFLKR